jgi:3D (Asp-Asp-Asp) domain-containing protein
MFNRWLALLILVSGYAGVAAAQLQQSDFSLPESKMKSGSSLELWATQYNVKRVEETASGVALRDRSGHALTGNLSARDWCLGAIEGTVQILARDTVHTFNYADVGKDVQVDCAATLKIDPHTRPWISGVGKSVFAPARGPYGDGASGYVLVPYRTIAADPHVIPIGSAVYVPRARGMKIGSKSSAGLTHDGYFFAGDSGGAIKGRHIDVFCGADEGNCLIDLIASNEKQTFDAYIVTDPALIAKLKRLHTL